MEGNSIKILCDTFWDPKISQESLFLLSRQETISLASIAAVYLIQKIKM